MFITEKYDFILKAQTPIAHHSESVGNEAIAMRRKVRQPDGRWCQVPTITGDTMRHGLREAAANAFLDAAGLLYAGQLGEAALRLLYAGGMVTGRGDAGSIKLDQFREMAELCPPLAILGGCADNRVILGRLHVDDATLVCEEQRSYLPPWVIEWDGLGQVDTCRAHIEEVQRVRMDPTLNPGKRTLLNASAEVQVASRLENSEMAHTADAAIEREEAKSTMMPRRFERIAQGSLFYWSLVCHCYSELDVDTLRVMVAAFLSDARVGGKRGTGHGQLRVVAAKDITVARPAETIHGLQLDGQSFGSLFRAHVTDRKERIAEWLAHVNA